jgi:hypothetical protein
MSEERDKKSGSGCFIKGAITFMLLPLYVLSVGPFTWLVWQCPALLVLDPAYRPVYFVAENYEAGNGCVELVHQLVPLPA